MFIALDVDIQGQLFPNIYTLLTQLGATLIIFIIFKKFLYKPVVDFLDARAEKMQEDLLLAQRQKQLADVELENAKKHFQEQVKKGKQLIESSVAQAHLEKEEILKAAKLEAAHTLSQASLEIENQKIELQSELNKQIVDVAMSATTKLLSEKMDQETQRQALQDFIDQVNRS